MWKPVFVILSDGGIAAVEEFLSEVRVRLAAAGRNAVGVDCGRCCVGMYGVISGSKRGLAGE